MTNPVENIEVPAVDSNAAYLALIEAMRKPDVTSGNSATGWGRETFKRLVSVNAEGLHDFTVEMAVIAVCEVYQPVTAKGKRANTKGALKDSGFPAMSQRLTTVERIMKQIGVEGVMPIVQAFIASTKNSDSFAALDLAVKEAVKAATPKPAASEGEGEGEGEGRTATAIDKLNAIVAVMAAFTASELAELATDEGQAALLAVSDALNAANDKAFEGQEMSEAA